MFVQKSAKIYLIVDKPSFLVIVLLLFANVSKEMQVYPGSVMADLR